MSVTEMRKQVISQIRKVKNPALLEKLSHLIASEETPENGKAATSFPFDWADGLKELKKGFTAVELQHYVHGLQREWASIYSPSLTPEESSEKRRAFLKRLMHIDKRIKNEFLHQQSLDAKKMQKENDDWKDFQSDDILEYD